MRIFAGIVVLGVLTAGLAGCGDAERPAAGPDAPLQAEDTATGGGDAGDAGDEDQPEGPHSVPIGAEDTTFHVGPWLGHTTTTSVVVSWETAAEEAGRVEVGSVEGGYERVLEAPAGTMHEVVVDGLEAGTVYHYRVCGEGDRCTRDLTLSTAPEAGRAFRFGVYGDSRSDPPRHRSMVDLMIEQEPALILHTGDVVEHGDPRSEYKIMHFDPARRLNHYVPTYVAIGNHEWKESDTDVYNFRDYFAFPKDPDVPLAELSYSVVYGDAFFLMLDNTVDGYHMFFPVGDVEPPLWQWLKKQAASEAAQKARWRFAFFHYPPQSPCNEDWAMLNATRVHVVPLLREHGFQAVFAGHVHAYERHDFDGFPVIVSGGGGAGLDHPENCVHDAPKIEVLRTVHHVVTVDLEGDTATVRAIDGDREVFDQLVIPQARR